MGGRQGGPDRRAPHCSPVQRGLLETLEGILSAVSVATGQLLGPGDGQMATVYTRRLRECCGRLPEWQTRLQQVAC